MSTLFIAVIMLIAIAVVFGIVFALYQFSILGKMELRTRLDYESIRVETLKRTRITK